MLNCIKVNTIILYVSQIIVIIIVFILFSTKSNDRNFQIANKLVSQIISDETVYSTTTPTTLSPKHSTDLTQKDEKMDQNLYPILNFVKSFWEEFPIDHPSPNNSDVIPDFYHYIQYGCLDFDTRKYISMYSVHKFSSKNAKIILHTDCPEVIIRQNKLFNEIEKVIREKLVILPARVVKEIFGQKIETIEHQTDVYRLLVIIHFGGTYIDSDIVYLKSHSIFRNSTVPVLGAEHGSTVANGFIMAPPNSEFLLRVLLAYFNYNPRCWACNSTRMYYSLSKKHPSEVHIEYDTICVPSWQNYDIILKENEILNWENYFNFHFSSRLIEKFKWNGKYSDLSDFDCMNNTLGYMVRHVLYNNSTLLCNKS